MYYAFLYVISNEGVDTQDSYPFKGKVNSSCVDLRIRNHCGDHIHSNPAAIMIRRTAEQAFLDLFPSPVVVSPTWKLLLLMLGP